MGLPIKLILPFDFQNIMEKIPAAQYSGSGSAGEDGILTCWMNMI